MKKLYCVICSKYRKFEKLWYHTSLKKHQFFLLFAVSASMKMKNYLKKKNQLKYWKFSVWLKINNYFKTLSEENIRQEFRSKTEKIDEKRNYFFEEIKQNKLMSKKHKMYNSNLYWTFPYFSLYNYWMYFNFCFCFFAWYLYSNYEFCIKIKNWKL